MLLGMRVLKMSIELLWEVGLLVIGVVGEVIGFVVISVGIIKILM